MAPRTKFVPLICNVNATSVAIDEGGEREEIRGTGLGVVNGPWVITNWAPLLLAKSVHGVPGSGVRIPEEASMEKPMICAKLVYPLVYQVDVV